MILLLMAAVMQHPNGMNPGIAAKRCAVLAAHKLDDHRSAPAEIAHKALLSCPAELAAIRNGFRAIVRRNIDPDTLKGRDAVAEYMRITIQAAERNLAYEIQSARRGSH